MITTTYTCDKCGKVGSDESQWRNIKIGDYWSDYSSPIFLICDDCLGPIENAKQIIRARKERAAGFTEKGDGYRPDALVEVPKRNYGPAKWKEIFLWLIGKYEDSAK